jgi:hypothetical protein
MSLVKLHTSLVANNNRCKMKSKSMYTISYVCIEYGLCNYDATMMQLSQFF